MGNPRLILLSSDSSEQEFRLTGSVSIGRASDNTVCIGQGTVALYHAMIEERRSGEGGFWLSDLGSIYGTTVNGKPVKSDHRLRDGDLISIGGAATLLYSENGVAGGRGAESDRRGRGMHLSSAAIAAVAAAGLIVVVIALLVIKWLINDVDCGTVKIVSPAPDATISEPVKIRVESDNPQCVKSISYRIDDQQFARPSANLFEAVLDPRSLKERFPGLTRGEHELSVAVETESEQTETVTDSFKVRIEFGEELSLEQIRDMAARLAARINQRGEIFVFSDEFLRRIRSVAQTFRSDMFSDAERAGPVIRIVSNRRGIPSQLMFVLAASRSRFREGQGSNGCGVDPNGVGIFKIPRAVLVEFGEEDAIDPEKVTQVAAEHVRRMIAGQKDDFFYAVACFGEPSRRIGEIVQRNDQQARRDFYSLVERREITPEEANRVVCFFAAGIVAENPEKFGINTKSLVEIY